MPSNTTLSDIAAARGEEVTTEVRHLAVEPLTLKALAELQDEETRVHRIKEQIAALKDQRSEQTAQMRAEYFKPHERKFADVDWKGAITGIKVVHPVRVGHATFRVCIPSAAREAALRTFLTAMQDKNQGLSPDEQVVLLWVDSTQLEGREEIVDQSMLSMDERLSRVRVLPALTLAALAEECRRLQEWITNKMEQDLGNF